MNKAVAKLREVAPATYEVGPTLAQDAASGSQPVIIKKYANRRLYNTETSSYVTLDDLGEMVRGERDFLVYDAKTREDLTRSVLTQIIVEEEGKGQNLLPIGFLRQLIRFYGHSIEHLVPKYLEFSLETLTREQEKYHNQFANVFSNAAFEAMQEQARQNIAMFERAMAMFGPFAQLDPASQTAHRQRGTQTEQMQKAEQPQMEDLAQLKAQLAAMQAQLDSLQNAKNGDEG